MSVSSSASGLCGSIRPIGFGPSVPPTTLQASIQRDRDQRPRHDLIGGGPPLHAPFDMRVLLFGADRAKYGIRRKATDLYEDNETGERVRWPAPTECSTWWWTSSTVPVDDIVDRESSERSLSSTLRGRTGCRRS